MILTESNVINHYLVDHYDKDRIFATSSEQDKYLVDKYLGFQSSTQAPFYAQVSIRSLLFLCATPNMTKLCLVTSDEGEGQCGWSCSLPKSRKENPSDG